MKRKLNICRGTHTSVGGFPGGARWVQRAKCPVCERSIGLTKTGRIRTHGKRIETKETRDARNISGKQGPDQG